MFLSFVYYFVLNQIHTEGAAGWKRGIQVDQVNLLNLRIYKLETNSEPSLLDVTPFSPRFPSLLSNPNTLNLKEEWEKERE